MNNEIIVNEQGRICTKCGQFKTWNNFHKATREKTGHFAQCISCRSKKSDKVAKRIINNFGRTCNKCGKFLSWSNYSADKHNARGKYTKCKECVKEYQIKNRDKIKEQRKRYVIENINKINSARRIYVNKNRDKIQKVRKEYTHKNSIQIKNKEKEWNSSFAKFSTYGKKLTIEESARKNKFGYLEVKCANSDCRKYFIPTNSEVKGRIGALKGRMAGELRLYCSEECKSSCSIYNRTKYPKGFKKQQKREYSREFRQMILERDEFTCQVCGEKFDPKYLQAHHLTPVVCSPMQQVDIENGICVCKECHKTIHTEEDGMSYGELAKVVLTS